MRDTKEEYEQGKGRVAVWLSPEDAEMLSKLWPDDSANDKVKDQYARIRFRSRAALHKAGLVSVHEPEESVSR
ncbi:hypothetical protein [Acetobacter tropicalis]|uniref:Uncharacterized protein n=1 Tax=Acetobacter tropicalis TaxID=104102 RepID=A0A252ABW6_9PROT|nr:hypothetical protein [Acetobacter tropicalis]OUI87088.1 hypothetical protein HC62_01385 [Acetobacter tropicalis]